MMSTVHAVMKSGNTIDVVDLMNSDSMSSSDMSDFSGNLSRSVFISISLLVGGLYKSQRR